MGGWEAEVRAPPDWTGIGVSRERSDQINREIDAEFVGRNASGLAVPAARHEMRKCVLPLDQLRGLPIADDTTGGSGVYFMWHGPVLVYVGQSRCVGNRIEQHGHRKPYTRITWLSVTADAWLRDYEGDYVRRYSPPFNLTRHG